MNRPLVPALLLLLCPFAAMHETSLAQRTKSKTLAPEMKRYTDTELAGRYRACRFKGLPYRFLEPPGFEKDEDRRYPLILSLHGAGGKGDDNLANLRGWNGVLAEPAFQEEHPCFVLVPQTTQAWRVPGPAPDLSPEALARFPEIWQRTIQGRKSFSTEFDQGDLGAVFELIDSLAETYPFDLDRVYVLGHSMGGFGSWSAIAEAPHRFAAAIPTAGGLAPWHDVKAIAHVPIWAFHGDKDTAVPVEMARHAFEQLTAAGGNMKYTECRGVGHGVNALAFVFTGDRPDEGIITSYSSDHCDRTPGIWDWLFAQNRNG